MAYENRISANHLPDEKQITDISKMPLTTFLPNVQEQEILAEELTTLVGLKWEEHIPSLKWFNEHLPDHIYHKHMEDVKKKTNKVGIDRKKMCSYRLPTILQGLIHSLFTHLSPDRVKRFRNVYICLLLK